MGQAYVLSNFNSYLINELGMTRSQLSQSFSIASLIGSFFLVWIGRRIDRLSFSRLVMVHGGILVFGLFMLSRAQGAMGVFFAYLLIKGFGQSPLTILYSSSSARLFGCLRGRAQSLTNLGHPLAQGLLPGLIAFLSGWLSWRGGLNATLLIFALGIIPLIIFLAHGSDFRRPLYNDVIGAQVNELGKRDRIDLIFYLATFGHAFVPFTMTSLIFHHDHMLNFYALQPSVFISGMSLAAGVQVVANLSIGSLVDRFSALKLLAYTNMPGILAIIAFYLGSELSIFIGFGLVGLAAPTAGSIKNSFWAEIYTSDKMGYLRGIEYKYIVWANCLGPMFYAFMDDQGVSVTSILFIYVVLGVISVLSHVLCFWLVKVREDGL